MITQLIYAQFSVTVPYLQEKTIKRLIFWVIDSDAPSMLNVQGGAIVIKEFKTFIAKGNMIDIAVGIIIGAAFGKMVTSFVNDIIMPPIGLLLGRVDFSNLFINISGKDYASLAEAKGAGAATINYGLFVNSIIDFLIVSLAIFLVVKQMNKMRTPAAATKSCPFCTSEITVSATRCPFCTSELQSG